MTRAEIVKERGNAPPIPRLLARADQALQTLERYRARLDSVNGALSALEVEDLVTVRDVVSVLALTEMVRRIAEEIEWYIVELGTDGRLAHLQLDELIADLARLRAVVSQGDREELRRLLQRAREARINLPVGAPPEVLVE